MSASLINVCAFKYIMLDANKIETWIRKRKPLIFIKQKSNIARDEERYDRYKENDTHVPCTHRQGQPLKADRKLSQKKKHK